MASARNTGPIVEIPAKLFETLTHAIGYNTKDMEGNNEAFKRQVDMVSEENRGLLKIAQDPNEAPEMRERAFKAIEANNAHISRENEKRVESNKPNGQSVYLFISGALLLVSTAMNTEGAKALGKKLLAEAPQVARKLLR